ncbi:uncharacterized protein I206_102231 [Kwoniella pini CBS 10737]|uniref:Uncharacterized protein n=1 Tax=Kwoniella pini CBS 10737 TaxID=1296096 RepID=A0A1B9HSX2_9TREE|nr:uncharacterized protein I206_07599 [Kwoniella pini CBS 10737]OCF46366.1 hypothetical protein I206_07599 [Kwoniella pini CBS 10737]
MTHQATFADIAKLFQQQQAARNANNSSFSTQNPTQFSNSSSARNTWYKPNGQPVHWEEIGTSPSNPGGDTTQNPSLNDLLNGIGGNQNSSLRDLLNGVGANQDSSYGNPFNHTTSPFGPSQSSPFSSSFGTPNQTQTFGNPLGTSNPMLNNLFGGANNLFGTSQPQYQTQTNGTPFRNTQMGSENDQNFAGYWNSSLGQTTKAQAFHEYLIELKEDTTNSANLAKSRGEMDVLENANKRLDNIQILDNALRSARLHPETAKKQYDIWGSVLVRTSNGTQRSNWDKYMDSVNGRDAPLNFHYRRIQELAQARAQAQAQTTTQPFAYSSAQPSFYTQGRPWSGPSVTTDRRPPMSFSHTRL